MKKIICGLAILLSLGVSVFAAPTAEQLAAKGIETKKGNDGNTYYVYPEINEPVVGKRYMLLNYNKEAKLQEDNGFYAVVLYEVIAKTDENAYKVGGKYVRSYPTAAYRITDSSFKLGKIITFKSVEDIFGKDALVTQTSISWGWTTQDPDLKIMVAHQFKNITVAAAPTAKQLAAKGIETQKGNDGNTRYVYPEMNEPVVGKRYMLLNYNREAKLQENNGFYAVALYEVIAKTDENAYKVGDKYVRSYPTAAYWITDSSFKLGKIITFKSVEDIFGKDAFVSQTWTDWGWATQDPDLKIMVEHKFQNNTVVAAPTAKQLAAKGIETQKGNDGNTRYVYSEMNEPVVGKRYMLLNYNKEAKLQENNGFYAVALYEVIAKTDENAYKVGDKYVRSYPTAAYWITDSSFKLGKIITFKSVEDIFGKDAFVSQTWTDWGWATQDPDLKIMVRHKFQNNTVASKSVNNNVASKSAAPTAEQLAKRGIETSGTFYIYSVMNEPVKGKSYMCLSWHRKTEKMPDDDGYYNVFLHEVIKSTDENSVEVNGTYVRYYPSLTVRINVDAVTFGDIIVFDSVETLFGKEWVTIRGPINNWGYATKDPVLDIDVNHKYRNHYVMVEK